jgi:hypothetical protein
MDTVDPMPEAPDPPKTDIDPEEPTSLVPVANDKEPVDDTVEAPVSINISPFISDTDRTLTDSPNTETIPDPDTPDPLEIEIFPPTAPDPEPRRREPPTEPTLLELEPGCKRISPTEAPSITSPEDMTTDPEEAFEVDPDSNDTEPELVGDVTFEAEEIKTDPLDSDALNPLRIDIEPPDPRSDLPPSISTGPPTEPAPPLRRSAPPLPRPDSEFPPESSTDPAVDIPLPDPAESIIEPPKSDRPMPPSIDISPPLDPVPDERDKPPPTPCITSPTETVISSPTEDRLDPVEI